MNNKKTIIILILVLTIGIVGLTVAYFSNSTSIDNTFRTRDYGTTTDEDFVSPDNWLPGTTTPKTLIVTNSGNVDEAVRISYTETWTSKNAKDNNQEGDLSLKQNNNDVAIINWANTDDWITVTENGVTYKYYKYKLAPQETTTSLLNSVTFNSAAVNNSNCVETTPKAGKKVITCDSTGNGYDGATYKLRFNVETVQYNQYRNAWGTNVALLDEKPLVVYGLNVNRKSKTYETGDKHQMFEFEHPATAQTPALTDYRYIGDDPYNYVYFNCTDDSDKNTCEVWRIIGVFSVDDGNGNWEQRIKLVKGTVLEETVEWDTNNVNDWSNASLKTYLNEIYFQTLSQTAKNQIEDSIYYLGSGKVSSLQPRYGTTENIYSWERGKEKFNESRTISWKGKIALMYPSDYGYTYAKGVDETCYSDLHFCKSNYNDWETGHPDIPGMPTVSWIYNTNKLEGQNLNKYVWFISPSVYTSVEIFKLEPSGMIINTGTYMSANARPVLYLKSSIQILSGEGTEQNPYILSSN